MFPVVPDYRFSIGIQHFLILEFFQNFVSNFCKYCLWVFSRGKKVSVFTSVSCCYLVATADQFFSQPFAPSSPANTYSLAKVYLESLKMKLKFKLDVKCSRPNYQKIRLMCSRCKTLSIFTLNTYWDISYLSMSPPCHFSNKVLHKF